MQIVDLSAARAAVITEFDSVGAAALALATGAGTAHVYTCYFEPGGRIGPHVAGFGQLFVPLTGRGWVAGADGGRVTVEPGQAAFWSRGELHSKGSETGMTALMIQVDDLRGAA